MRRTNIYLTNEQRATLAARAAAEDTSVAELVRRLVDQALFGANEDLADDLGASDNDLGERILCMIGDYDLLTSVVLNIYVLPAAASAIVRRVRVKERDTDLWVDSGNRMMWVQYGYAGKASISVQPHMESPNTWMGNTGRDRNERFIPTGLSRETAPAAVLE